MVTTQAPFYIQAQSIYMLNEFYFELFLPLHGSVLAKLFVATVCSF